MPGWTRSVPPDSGRAYIAPEFLQRKERAALLPRKIFGRMLRDETSGFGSRTTHVRRRPAAQFRLRRHRKAVLRLRTCGSLRNLHDGRILRRSATTTVQTGIVIRREWIRRAICTWM